MINELLAAMLMIGLLIEGRVIEDRARSGRLAAIERSARLAIFMPPFLASIN